MASKNIMGMIWCMMVLMAVGATAETYNVGNEINWGVPPLGGIAYRTWARTINFESGDIIVFNWTGTHNVARVSREEYDACTFNNPIGPIQMSSPVNFTIGNDTTYYLCTVDRHCDLGQKVAIPIDGTSASSRTTIALFSILFTLAISMFTIM